MMTETKPVDALSVQNLEAVYNGVVLVLKGISLTVPKGKIVALLGANGAGKTTMLKCISNLIRAERGEVTQGRIMFGSKDITATEPSRLVSMGAVLVMEGRHCFPHLTVEENIVTGGYVRHLTSAQITADLERMYTYFPRLKERRKSLAGFTSGGEQQMTAIARALMTRPELLLLDEPSMGLAPQLVAEIFSIVKRLNQEDGMSILLAEQNTNMALKHADYGYVVENGLIAMHGTGEELRSSEDVKR